MAAAAAAAAAAAWDYLGRCIRPKQPLVVYLLFILVPAFLRRINIVGEAVSSMQMTQTLDNQSNMCLKLIATVVTLALVPRVAFFLELTS